MVHNCCCHCDTHRPAAEPAPHPIWYSSWPPLCSRVSGVITTAEAFAGFSNSGMLTIAFLFVVAAALCETGVLNYVGRQLLGGATSDRGVLRRLVLVVIPSSAFLNNTPIVAMLMPVVIDWCRHRQVSPSKLLIPLSYLAILGGTCTLIGTSTNLVVHGLMIRNGIRGMGLFEIGVVGVPYAIVGVFYLMTIGPRLLPARLELLEQLGKSRREYVVEMQVQPGSRIVGKTIESAGLRRLHGLFLIEIDRDGTHLSPARPDEILQAGDRLVFAGIVSSVVELQQLPGLVPIAQAPDQASAGDPSRRRMTEVVVSASSRLIGRTIRAADFRTTYGAVVVAVHRGGSRLESKLGDVCLQPGDTLLLQTPPHFACVPQRSRVLSGQRRGELSPLSTSPGLDCRAPVRRSGRFDGHGSRRGGHCCGTRGGRHGDVGLHLRGRGPAECRMAGSGDDRRGVWRRRRPWRSQALPARSPASSFS